MLSSLYPKLAFTNLRNNKSTYFPYMLSSIVCIMTYYIMQSIAMVEGLYAVPGGAIAMAIFSLGTVIISIFCIVLMFYTNSFLIKRRKKELGLYCVLGMEKRHVALVLFYETLYTSLICLFLGLIFGILFSKLLFMALLYLLDFTTPIAFSISIPSIFCTIFLFLCIYGATLLYNMMHIRLANPVELLHGGQKGEKEPKTSWLLTIIGILSLGGGYFISQYYKDPLNALLLFFLAVFLVIVGTFCLFTSGSIALLKALRKKKRFYYQPNNFISIGGMIYRMKQNAAGLASICILSTMVLVTISTTVSLYAGRDKMLASMYPLEISVSASYSAEDAEMVRNAFSQAAAEAGLDAPAIIEYNSFSVAVAEHDGQLISTDSQAYSELVMVKIILLADYNRINNMDLVLAEHEALGISSEKYTLPDTLTFGHDTIQIRERGNNIELFGTGNNSVFRRCVLVVADENVARNIYTQLGGQNTVFDYSAGFYIDLPKQEIISLAENINTRLPYPVYCRAAMQNEWNGMYGSFLFLGVFLGSLFIMATVLIIYYKQISEGYEDHDRFRIMQQVGMSQKEVKRAINKQILLVFFLPLLMAALHMVFAFEIICNLLLVFGMSSRLLFFGCTIVTFLIFALAYIAVYRVTAKTYYRLVQA